MKYLNRILSAIFTLSIILFTWPAHADDKPATTVKNEASDAKTNTKKNWRKTKRKVRKATGNDTVGKDVKDSVNDAGDDINNAAKKTKNKVNE